MIRRRARIEDGPRRCNHPCDRWLKNLRLYISKSICVGDILKTKRAADLPVGRPTKFGFVINIKAAKLLGVEFSQRSSRLPTA
jgi:hypothetical protein